MSKEKVLVVAKTYPLPSKTHDELVCTAGLREDGSWVRIYPVPFRKLDYDKQYKKFQWIEVDIVRNYSDSRPESHKIKNYSTIKVVGEIPKDKDGSWYQRRRILLNDVYTNKETLVNNAYEPDKKTSLAVFKPIKITNFIIKKEEDRDWDKEKLEYIKARAQQIDLFAGEQNPFNVVKKVPYTFYYEFLDDENEKSKLRIIDWEIGALYWNCFKRNANDEEKTCKDIYKKYWDDFALTKDVHLILGTTLEHHNRNAPNPFVIIGIFAPEYTIQERLEL